MAAANSLLWNCLKCWNAAISVKQEKECHIGQPTIEFYVQKMFCHDVTML